MNTDVLKGKKRKKGFTLVELIIVIAVLVVLAAVMYPLISGYVKDAQEATAISACQTCVHAAKAYLQKLFAEESDMNQIYRKMTDENIREYGGIKSGTIQVAITYKYTFNDTLGASYDPAKPNPHDVVFLTYTDNKSGVKATYVSTPEPHYVIGQGVQWETGQTYEVGDIMYSGGYIFRCLRAHTTGTTSRTRDPSLRSNKSSWEVIGYTDGPKQYSSTVRYAAGMVVEYKDKWYARTEFNLVGGQVPYETKNSDYWLIVPAP